MEAPELSPHQQPLRWKHGALNHMAWAELLPPQAYISRTLISGLIIPPISYDRLRHRTRIINVSPAITLSPKQMARRRRPPRPGALTELPPLWVARQIVLLQVIWYAVATALILFTALVAGKHFSFDLVLSWRSLRGDTTVGWMLGLVWLLNSFIGCASFRSLPT